MNFGRIWDLIADKDIDPQELFAIANEVTNLDTTDEVNLRRVIRSVAKVAKKNLTSEIEDRLVAKIQKDGVDLSLFDSF